MASEEGGVAVAHAECEGALVLGIELVAQVELGVALVAGGFGSFEKLGDHLPAGR